MDSKYRDLNQKFVEL
jgi:hypothetical protein